MTHSPALAESHDSQLEARHQVGSQSEIHFVRSEGGIEEYRLASNGLRVLFMAAHAAPVALLMLTYGVGSGDEEEGFQGASHLLEHMMFKGSARFAKRDGTSILELLQPLGGQANATTSLDRTNYFNLVPASHLELVAEIEADRMRGLRLDPADLEAERTVVLNEHDRHIGDPLAQLDQAVLRAAFANHPYGAPVLGSRADIERLSRDALVQHYERFYWPRNATLTCIGDLEREATLAILARCFGPVPAGSADFDSKRGTEPEQCSERRVAIARSGQPGMLMLAYKSPEGLDPDADALELLGGILVGGKLSRLYRSLIGTGLASHAWSDTARLRQQGLFQVQALLGATQDHGEVERLIRDAIDLIRRDGVSQSELDRAKGQARGNCLTSRDGPVAIAMQINEAIAAGDWRAYPRAVERIASVQLADLQRVAERYLRDERLTVGYLS